MSCGKYILGTVQAQPIKYLLAVVIAKTYTEYLCD
jgi:hypothetical protein